ncbi:MAG: ATP-binding protein [Bacteroidales bacterium]|jgi:hypothetical protein|nr:ATP-binding protein [Bacteroidales bacterium]
MLTLALNILDIAQNSIRAKASEIFVGISESLSDDRLEITVRDNGSGISQGILDKVTDPFFTTRTTRKTGLGLPLLKYQAGIAGGDLVVESHEGMGTTVKASFTLSHVDRQPLGDIAGVMTILMTANPEIDFLYSHRTDSGEYFFSSKEAKEYLGIENFTESGLASDIREMFDQNLKEIGADGMKD